MLAGDLQFVGHRPMMDPLARGVKHRDDRERRGMPASFAIQPQDLLIWGVIGLLGGLIGGLVARGGTLKLGDALLGIVPALLGGVATEFLGMRETGEAVGAMVVAFFSAMLVTAVVRLLPGRSSG